MIQNMKVSAAENTKPFCKARKARDDCGQVEWSFDQKLIVLIGCLVENC